MSVRTARVTCIRLRVAPPCVCDAGAGGALSAVRGYDAQSNLQSGYLCGVCVCVYCVHRVKREGNGQRRPVVCATRRRSASRAENAQRSAVKGDTQLVTIAVGLHGCSTRTTDATGGREAGAERLVRGAGGPRRLGGGRRGTDSCLLRLAPTQACTRVRETRAVRRGARRVHSHDSNTEPLRKQADLILIFDS